MCGIAAIVTSQPPADLRRTIEEMTGALEHRGPDDDGFATFEADGVALGMRRLSIVDLEGGKQPLWDESRTRCVVFNGEIYGYDTMRRELERLGHRFATDHSDTEVLVHGYEEWGDDLPARLNGMFAFAIWDRARRELFIARDRAGEKPLYIATVPGGYAIASELKALLRYPELRPEVDPVGLEQYLEWGYTIAPQTILRDVAKLPPGHSARLTPRSFETRSFWMPSFESDERPEGELLEELDGLLDRSVELRMVADVPVGLLLSGGLDSTTIGWYMRRHSDEVHSYSIGFEDDAYDESAYSELAARHLGTKHHLELMSEERARELVPRIAEIFDEPVGDQSVFPTFLLSTVTRRGVKVALGGDGSDELLMGYSAYGAARAAARFDRLPLPARRGAAMVARRIPTRVGGRALRGVGSLRTLDRPTSARVLSYLGAFKGEARVVLAPEARAAAGVHDGLPALLPARKGDVDREATETFLRGYLPEDILTKTDRASMAASLELRAPFLDPHVIDFLLRLPSRHKLDGGTGKVLLKRLMAGRLPNELVHRPKRGFDVPLNRWLRESLAPLVREALAPERLRVSGLLEPGAVGRIVDDHLSGRADRGREVWLLLQFELWRERWL
jgi:asparagine synthase (glutamine-hydrolysing)